MNWRLASSSNLNVRWMIRRDMPDVIALDQADGGPEWSEDDFLHMLRQRNCIGMVAERGDTIIGFIIYELYRRRLHLANIVAFERDVANALIEKLQYKVQAHRRERITTYAATRKPEMVDHFARYGFTDYAFPPKPAPPPKPVPKRPTTLLIDDIRKVREALPGYDESVLAKVDDLLTAYHASFELPPPPMPEHRPARKGDRLMAWEAPPPQEEKAPPRSILGTIGDACMAVVDMVVGRTELTSAPVAAATAPPAPPVAPPPEQQGGEPGKPTIVFVNLD